MTDLERSAGLNRLRAINQLGASVRGAVAAAVSTECDVMALDEARELIDRASHLLEQATRRSEVRSSLDALVGRRAFSPVHGEGNAISPPLRLSHSTDAVEGRCTLGVVYEGPRMYVHGGVSAMLLDEVTAKVPQLKGVDRVTGSLTVRFRRPVPLEVPLLLRGRWLRDEGQIAVVHGSISREDRAEDELVVAEARFVRLTESQRAGLAAGWSSRT